MSCSSSSTLHPRFSTVWREPALSGLVRVGVGVRVRVMVMVRARARVRDRARAKARGNLVSPGGVKPGLSSEEGEKGAELGVAPLLKPSSRPSVLMAGGG